MDSLMLRAHDSKPRLYTQPVCGFNVPSNVTFNQSTWNFLLSTKKLLIGPFCSP